MAPKDIRMFQDLESLTAAVAEAFVDRATKVIKENDVFTVALTGGSTVKNLHTMFASPEYQSKVAWRKIRFFWGDERLVPPDHPESNYGQAYRLFLGHVGVRPENIFRIRGELVSQEAVQDYKEKLREHAPEGLEWPPYDLVFLSLGSDGHIASIFPGEISEAERCFPVIGTTADYQGRPAERVSMTPLVFNSARQIFFLVSGESKAAALRMVFCGEGDPKDFPALRIRPEEGVITWFVDEAAASLLS
jgi:6-phosphogluconolactonase